MIAGGAPGLHFYSLNQAALTTAIWQRLGFAWTSAGCYLPRRLTSNTPATTRTAPAICAAEIDSSSSTQAKSIVSSADCADQCGAPARRCDELPRTGRTPAVPSRTAPSPGPVRRFARGWSSAESGWATKMNQRGGGRRQHRQRRETRRPKACNHLSAADQVERIRQRRSENESGADPTLPSRRQSAAGHGRRQRRCRRSTTPMPQVRAASR